MAVVSRGFRASRPNGAVSLDSSGRPSGVQFAPDTCLGSVPGLLRAAFGLAADPVLVASTVGLARRKRLWVFSAGSRCFPVRDDRRYLACWEAGCSAADFAAGNRIPLVPAPAAG